MPWRGRRPGEDRPASAGNTTHVGYGSRGCSNPWSPILMLPRSVGPVAARSGQETAGRRNGRVVIESLRVRGRRGVWRPTERRVRLSRFRFDGWWWRSRLSASVVGRGRLIRCGGCFCIMNSGSLPDDWSRAFRRLERLSGPRCRRLECLRVLREGTPRCQQERT
jgi:hypothetical protein